MIHRLRTLVLALVVLLATLAPARAGDETVARRTSPWPRDALDVAAHLAIQDGGRVKPLSTFASFTLLRFHGTRTIVSGAGERLDATAWLLDLLFFPDAAARYPTFLVQDADVANAIGLSIDDKAKRDRWSFEELRPGLQRLMALAHEYDRVDPKQRTSLQTQVVNLAENVLAFARLSRHEGLAIVPPARSVAEEPAWSTPSEWRDRASRGETPSPAQAELLASFDAMLDHAGDATTFAAALERVHARSVELASARGEIEELDLEVAYYRADLLTWSLAGFVLAFLAAALSWLWPARRFLGRATWVLVLLATGALVAAIAMRCAIRGRPPVSTLYETVLFVTAVGALLALVLERLNRGRVAISAAAALGMLGLFLANAYETLDKQDTMPSLVAVLDTNFWLATHVTAITIGYGAGMFAALLANVYVATKLIRAKRFDRAFHASLARMVYGVLCFGVIFATVGTILGGIWANESWGRFWGWDPKENGALLIVIAELVILHARMGGVVREDVWVLATAFLGSVVAFSWWGVNLLGVGLHSYGFTSGIQRALWTYYALQWGLVVAGGIAAWRARRTAKRERIRATIEIASVRSRAGERAPERLRA